MITTTKGGFLIATIPYLEMKELPFYVYNALADKLKLCNSGFKFDVINKIHDPQHRLLALLSEFDRADPKDVKTTRSSNGDYTIKIRYRFINNS